MIRVENLSKRFVLGHQRNRHDGLRHRIEDAVRSPFRWLRRGNGEARSEGEEFWALKDVSFGVERGEVVGVIGRNGAGKSTLLKILSRITEPTRGRARIRGRVASLLEVGTGFHPELTGRENIFLNGAILGMTRVEIKKKFDEIVAFSEVERFLDTPVKRYSSGMYVRLAFAVAAHLEPEILIIDEVLAVGDAEFQKKCLGKMQDVSTREGRTVLFVSHNMNAVQRLCSKTLVLKQGRIQYWGNVNEGMLKYSAHEGMKGMVTYESEKPVRPFARIVQLEILAEGRQVTGPLKPGDDVVLKFNLQSGRTLGHPTLTVGITDHKGDRIFAIGTPFGPKPLPAFQGGLTVGIGFTMPPVQPGTYQLDVGFYDQHEGTLQEIYAAGSLEVAEANYLTMTHASTSHLGHILVRSSWTAENYCPPAEGAAVLKS